MQSIKEQCVWALLRISMGWLLLWAFLDKLFGLGFETAPEKAWLAGGSPTFGFLKFGVKGPFADFYHALAGNPLVDWLFMLGLLFIGVSLILGIAMRLATIAGILMFAFMYMALLLPIHNPIIDEHIIYILVLLTLLTVKAGDYCGLGKYWNNLKIVQKFSLLK